MPASVDLGSDLEDIVDSLVRSGRFGSRGEVLREGVRLVEAREARQAALDAALSWGLADADHDRVKPLDAVTDRLIAKYGRIAEERAD